MDSILLIGFTGYVGEAFHKELLNRGISCYGINSKTICTAQNITEIIRSKKITFVINAAGYVGKPNVDSCELTANKADCILANVILPAEVRKACESTDTPFGHISTGCLYNGGCYKEDDAPNHYSFYSHSKALGEEVLAGANAYVWRIRMPFNEINNPRNYLTKILSYDTLITEKNSISHLGDFVSACLDCFQIKAPFGTYNVTNPGTITPEEIVSMMRKYGLTDKIYKFTESKDLPGIVAKRSNCLLDTSKLKSIGIILPDVREAIEDCLRNWRN